MTHTQCLTHLPWVDPHSRCSRFHHMLDKKRMKKIRDTKICVLTVQKVSASVFCIPASTHRLAFGSRPAEGRPDLWRLPNLNLRLKAGKFTRYCWETANSTMNPHKILRRVTCPIGRPTQSFHGLPTNSSLSC